MITALASKVANYFVKKGVAEEEDIEIYQYGVGLFLSTVFNIATILIVSLFTGMFWGTALFLISFISLRELTGGYHADSYTKCSIIFFVVYALCALVFLLTPDMYVIPVIIGATVVSAILILALSPVESNNKPLTDEHKAILRKKSIALFSLQVFVVFMGIHFLEEFMKVFYFASLGYITASISLAVAVINDKERR